jgi:glycosyltransferase involved in cell wall biosynthesis
VSGVSVVVPTRGRDQLLVRAVTAVAAQEHTGPLEVVVVRDGTPAVPIAVDLPAHVTLRQVPNTRSPGLPGARNTGVLAATGDLVAFCDDDDEWLPGKLAAQLALLAARPDAALVATGIVVVPSRAVEGGTAGGTAAGTEHLRPGPAHDVLLGDLLDDRIMELHPSGFLLRRADLVGPIGLVDEELAGGYGEDYDLLLRAAAHGPVVAVQEPFVRVHWHDGSYYFSRWQTIHDALETLLAKHPFTGSPRGTARIRGQQALALAATGRRGAAVRTAGRALRLAPTEKRAYLAVAVAGGVLDVDRLQRWLHRRGRGL